ncbi:hypothetical protein GCM10023149_06920 [Mucilaginibacter gynuensis]|uniref:PDZ domain-containing protein n=1 Tax=Mucilaginibacter gynuensis TaxID=1302236 RepID=A0ABP8FVP4_9SPHI
MKKLQLFVVVLFVILLPSIIYGQKFDRKTLEVTLHKAIEKAYPASVRMWGFDTVSKMQMSAQFSGVVVAKDGYILTAAHTTVVGKTYKVMFPNGKEAIALALGRITYEANPIAPDVAMMKIITQGSWPYAEMASSSALKVNEPCISIAYPETLNQRLPSVRFGRITNVKNDLGFVQSTCIMEPGDSGGPLFDYMGRVIALHSAINVDEATNYEIPVDYYRTYWSALNKVEDYKALPVQKDSVAADPFANKILTIPALTNVSEQFKTDLSKLATNTIKITSTIAAHQQSINGITLSLDGMGLPYKTIIISKSSMIGDEPVVSTGGGKSFKLNILARDKANDIVILQAPAAIKNGIKLNAVKNDTLVFNGLGKLLLSPLPDTIGVVSVLGSMQINQPKVFSMGFLGAAIAYKEGPLVLTRIQPNSPASEAGLEIGDQVLNINDKPMQKPEDYGAELQKYWPGDKVTFKVSHAGNTLTKEITLISRPPMGSNHPAEMFAGGKSIRRDGFEKVFTHDAIIKANHCGGPVFDTDGNFYGINIARFSRTSTLAIPAAVISQLVINALKNSNTQN